MDNNDGNIPKNDSLDEETHQCCEDLGNKAIFKYQDTWTLYHHMSDTVILTDISFCPFCGVRLP